MLKWIGGFLAFWWDVFKRTLRLLLGLYKRADLVGGFLTWLGVGVVAYLDLIPLRAAVYVGVVLALYAVMAAIFEKFRAVEGERDALRAGVETEEKRAAIATGLQRLYNNGVALRTEVFNSTDETPVSECQENMRAWQQGVIDYLAGNVSRGKAQYVDGVTSVRAASLPGMPSIETRGDKETIVLHLDARLKRLAEVMREY